MRLVAAAGTSFLLALLLLAGPIVSAGGDDPFTASSYVTTFYLIRHAEKEVTNGRDPALTEQGRYRAKKWAEVFQRVAFDVVYSTDTIRTRETAAPTAQSQSLPVQLYDALSVNYAEFIAGNLNKTVLVVGHSNTTPAFVNGLLGKQAYAQMDDDDNSSLFIVDITAANRIVRVLRIDAELGEQSTSSRAG
ncbi:MAG: histidine phosphatase family protein [Gammaproteobacteria bacterium]|nr:histidine phosphatase family protein [Gammaproteobacteria bacterium]